jgi:hypothetical protein
MLTARHLNDAILHHQLQLTPGAKALVPNESRSRQEGQVKWPPKDIVIGLQRLENGLVV